MNESKLSELRMIVDCAVRTVRASRSCLIALFSSRFDVRDR
jgi:hypothetical protein